MKIYNNHIFEDYFDDIDDKDIESNISSSDDDVKNSVNDFPDYELCFGKYNMNNNLWLVNKEYNILSPNKIKKLYNRIYNLRYMDNVVIRFQAGASDEYRKYETYYPDVSKFSEYNLMSPEEFHDYISKHTDKYDYINLTAIHIYYDKPNINTDDVNYAVKLILEGWDLFIDLMNELVESAISIKHTAMLALCLKKSIDKNKESKMLKFYDYLYIKEGKYNDSVSKVIGSILPVIDCFPDIPLEQRDSKYYDTKYDKIFKAVEKKPDKMKITIYNALKNSGFRINIIKKIKFELIKNLGIILITIPKDTTISLKNISLGTLLSDFNKMDRVKLRVEGTLLIDDISAYDCLNYIDYGFDNNEIVISAPRTKRIMDLINNIGFKKIIEI